MSRNAENQSVPTNSFYVLKYLLLLFIVVNIASSIWVGIYNKLRVEHIKWIYPDDRWTGDGDRGSTAEIWEKLCITYLVFMNLFNLMGIFGAILEHYCILQIFSVIMFASSVYGAGGGYISGSVSSYIAPFIVAVLALGFSHQIRVKFYAPAEEQTKPIPLPRKTLMVKNSIYEAGPRADSELLHKNSFYESSSFSTSSTNSSSSKLVNNNNKLKINGTSTYV